MTSENYNPLAAIFSRRKGNGSDELREVPVYDSPKVITVLGEEDELVSEALLQGLRLRISELFQQPALA